MVHNILFISLVLLVYIPYLKIGLPAVPRPFVVFKVANVQLHRGADNGTGRTRLVRLDRGNPSFLLRFFLSGGDSGVEQGYPEIVSLFQNMFEHILFDKPSGVLQVVS